MEKHEVVNKRGFVRRVPVQYNVQGERKVTISVSVDQSIATIIAVRAVENNETKSKVVNDALRKGLQHE